LGTPSRRIVILLHAVHRIAVVAEPLLSRVTWLLVSLVSTVVEENSTWAIYRLQICSFKTYAYKRLQTIYYSTLLE